MMIMMMIMAITTITMERWNDNDDQCIEPHNDNEGDGSDEADYHDDDDDDDDDDEAAYHDDEIHKEDAESLPSLSACKVRISGVLMSIIVTTKTMMVNIKMTTTTLMMTKMITMLTMVMMMMLHPKEDSNYFCDKPV